MKQVPYKDTDHRWNIEIPESFPPSMPRNHLVVKLGEGYQQPMQHRSEGGTD
ncbi:hypothetical protein Sjap_026076 [Stephania japonica]|uniref:Uncharacterized protein n=1 Tax=Stephania japonica TaxID=461633 RepID=A0AAP0HK43_9MAGN